jgi:hypothetical protein
MRGLADTDAFDLSLPLWSIILISVLANCREPASFSNDAVASFPRPLPLGQVQQV